MNTYTQSKRTLFGHWAGMGAATVLALGLVACGGSSNKKSTPPTPMDVDMTGVHGDAMKEDGTTTLEPGGKVTYGDVTYTCAAGGASCVLMVKDGKATYTGGTVTAATQASFAQVKKAEKDKADAIAAAVTRADTAMKAAKTAKDLATDGQLKTATEDGKTGTKGPDGGSGEAVMNIVPMQTGGMAMAHHKAAAAAAAEADDEYDKAVEAHKAAADEEATEVVAVQEADKAEAAQKAAETAAATANTEAAMAVTKAPMELMFDADTMTYSVTKGDYTGSIKVPATVTENTLIFRSKWHERATEEDAGTGKSSVEAQSRELMLGATHSGNNTHLRLVNKYFNDMVGKMYVVDSADTSDPANLPSGAHKIFGMSTQSNGYVQIQVGDQTLNRPLTRVTDPTYVRHLGDESDLTTFTHGLGGEPQVASNFTVARKSKNEGDLYYYLDRDGKRAYLHLPVDDRPLYGTAENDPPIGKYVAVYPNEKYASPVRLPVMYDHEHIHFGLWNRIDISDSTVGNLGIGFVRTLDGKSMTGDMPIEGTATYRGGWVATVRAKAEDPAKAAFANFQGISEVKANFEQNSVMVDLTEYRAQLGNLARTDPKVLAKLEGTIDGSGFMGTSISGIEDIGLLEATSDGAGFSGKFSGAFYGPKAEEVGGVFDFDGEKKGAFRGAFGGGKN